jgi:hypothetical protein
MVQPACELPLSYGGAAGHFVSARVTFSAIPLVDPMLHQVLVDSATLAERLGTIPASGLSAGSILPAGAPQPLEPNYGAAVRLRFRTAAGLDSVTVSTKCFRYQYGDPVEEGGDVLEG